MPADTGAGRLGVDVAHLQRLQRLARSVRVYPFEEEIQGTHGIELTIVTYVRLALRDLRHLCGAGVMYV